jgi:hypothetical protein
MNIAQSQNEKQSKHKNDGRSGIDLSVLQIAARGRSVEIGRNSGRIGAYGSMRRGDQ